MVHTLEAVASSRDLSGSAVSAPGVSRVLGGRKRIQNNKICEMTFGEGFVNVVSLKYMEYDTPKCNHNHDVLCRPTCLKPSINVPSVCYINQGSEIGSVIIS